MTRTESTRSVAHRVHPTALVSPETHLEEDVEVGAYTVLQGRMRVGAGTKIGHHCVIGGRPKIRGYEGPVGEIVIGSRATIAEFCAIDAPRGEITRLGDEVFVMPHCYVGHDCGLGSGVTLMAGCCLGGYVWLGERTVLGLSTVVHQRSSLGALVMAGMASVVNRDVPPFASVRGNPARTAGVNRVGMLRAGLTAEQIEDVAAALSSWTPRTPWPLDIGKEWIAEFEGMSRRPFTRAAGS